APARATAGARLSQALRDRVYLGIPTTVDVLKRVVDDAAFRTAAISTDMLKHRPELAAGDKAGPDDHALAAAVLTQALGKAGGGNGGAAGAAGSGGDAGSTAVWQTLGGFRLFEGAAR
ncbi:MAG: hypothetical protein ACK58X_08955, partial [Planctomycetota bacterium]